MNAKDRIKRYSTKERLRLSLTPEIDTAIILDDEEDNYYIAKYTAAGTVFERIVTEKDLIGLGGGGSGSYLERTVVFESAVTVTHNFGYYPSVTVTDSAGYEISVSIQHLNSNQLVILSNVPFSGKAVLK